MSNSLAIWDWVVFTGVLVISTCIGIYHALTGGRQKTTGEFLNGNRRMKLLPVAISILVSFQSAILILGAPAEMYTKGTQYYLYTFGQIFATFLASVLYVPLFYPLKLTSVNEYMELRYKSRAAKLVSTFINISATLMYTGIASFAPSTALYAVSGFPEWASFLVIGFVCTFYTFMGGLKAVVWVDAFQGVVMIIGLISIVIQGTISVGGFDKVWEINDKWDRVDFWNFDPDPTVRHTFWALVFGTMISWTGTYGASQPSIQRYSSLPSMKQARIAVLLNSVGVFILLTSSCLSGIVVFAYFAKIGCDPLKHKGLKNPNQLIPYFVMEALGYPGFPGLFIACLYSGALSSISSNYNSLTAMTWEDLLKPFLNDRTETTKAWITRLVVIVYGVLGIGVALFVKNLGGTVLQLSLSFMGAAGGSLDGMIVLAAFFPWSNWIGVIAGGLCSYAVTMWISFAKYSVVGIKQYKQFPEQNCSVEDIKSIFVNSSNYLVNSSYTFQTTTDTSSSAITYQRSGLDQFYSLSYLWYATLGILITVVVGLIVSVITGPTKSEDVDPKYIIPIFDRLCCYLPKSLRHRLHCGVPFKKTYTKVSVQVELAACDKNEVHLQNGKTDISSKYTLTED